MEMVLRQHMDMNRCVDLNFFSCAVRVLACCWHLQKQRSHQKHDFFRKTKRGQPVMKYRVDKILAQLQQEKAAGT
jgi:hypothetical protein